jgi:hypothetical protein
MGETFLSVRIMPIMQTRIYATHLPVAEARPQLQ